MTDYSKEIGSIIDVLRKNGRDDHAGSLLSISKDIAEERQSLLTEIESLKHALHLANGAPNNDADEGADEDKELAKRMKSAGMFTIDEMMTGKGFIRFGIHAGIRDLESFEQWLESQCRSFLTMQARQTLDKREDDDLFEWVLAHSSVFRQVLESYRHAKKAKDDDDINDGSVPSDGQEVH